MTDYLEEQTGEIEALQSIYPKEFEVVQDTPYPKLKITVESEEYDGDSDQGLACTLWFTYGATYPDEPPEIEITDDNFEESDLETLMETLVQMAQDNVGMVMVFTLVSGALEWMNDRWDTIKLEREREEERKIKEAEENERRALEGTRVTVESFMAWKFRFDQEMNGLKRDDLEDKETKKLTGKELFLRDKTLNESDLKFVLEDDVADVVKVDESLFQDLDDLDIEDDEAS